jgi:hypothetical protein
MLKPYDLDESIHNLASKVMHKDLKSIKAERISCLANK